MNIKIISVGKLKEKYLKLGIEEFTKRLSKYCSLEIIEVDDEKAPENLSDKEMIMIKDKEGDKILSKIKDNTYVIALAIDGKMLSSEDLAEKLEDLAITGKSNIAFVIGGSLGLSDAVLKRADYKLSFSKMTFPHQMMKLILLEQVYRAYRIIKGEPYHKWTSVKILIWYINKNFYSDYIVCKIIFFNNLVRNFNVHKNAHLSIDYLYWI